MYALSDKQIQIALRALVLTALHIIKTTPHRIPPPHHCHQRHHHHHHHDHDDDGDDHLPGKDDCRERHCCRPLRRKPGRVPAHCLTPAHNDGNMMMATMMMMMMTMMMTITLTMM